jgi:hypothetical protein
VQIQQRQHLTDLWGLARPRRQDRRGKPLSLTGIGVDTFVVNSRSPNRHRPRRGQHVAFLTIAVAYHQPAPVLVELIGELLHVGGDLGLQRRSQHLTGTLADNLIKQRP